MFAGETCVHGSGACTDTNTNMNTLVVAAGGPNEPFTNYDDVEVIDLSGKGKTCRNLAGLYRPIDGAVGAYFDEMPMVCVGINFDDPSSSGCFEYHAQGPQGPWWVPSTPRLRYASQDPASVILTRPA